MTESDENVQRVSGLNQLTWDPNSAKNERLDNKHLSQKME
jgi:hypothetical protein